MDGSTGLPPAAIKTASAPIALSTSGSAFAQRRTSTPASSSCACIVSTNSVIIPLFGGIAARLAVPPSLSCASNKIVSNPRLASVRAASMPAGPPPMTATLRPVPFLTSFSSPYSNSRPRTGLTVHPRGSPSLRILKHSMHPRHLRIRMSLPAFAFLPQLGSAKWPRAMPTKSTAPFSSIFSAKAGCLTLQTAMTGIFTALRMLEARLIFHPSAK